MTEQQVKSRVYVADHGETLSTKRKMILPLQAVRAIACMMIFVYHGIGSRIQFAGVWGVSVFFVLSGFVLVYSYWDRPIINPTIKDAATFSWNKIKKLFPLHVIMLIVGLIRELLQEQDTIVHYIMKLGLTIPLLQTWSPIGYQALNSVDWYLSVTLFLYFVFPFILNRLKKQSPNRNNVLLIISSIYCTQIVVGALFNYLLPNINIKWIVYCFPLYRLGDFAIGCLLGYLFTVTPDNLSLLKKKSSMAEWLIVLLTIISWTVYYFSNESLQWLTYTCLFLPFSAGLIIIFAKGDGCVSRIITNRLTLFLAGISSYFFLIHRQMLYYVQAGIKKIFHIETNTYLNLAIFLIISFALTLLAVAIYKMIDKWMHKKTVNS
ncbi:MAG: acyltransferase [Eubacteriales bacterium]|nr:acyltransferase [Eubacteriales bacterium]